MEINIYFNNLESTAAIKSYIENKIGKTIKYLEEPVNTQVTISVEKLNHIVKVNLNAHGYIVHVEEKDTNLYSAIDLVSDILERKIKKYLEKIKSKKGRRGSQSLMIKEEVIPTEYIERNEKKVIKVKNYELKPMDLDEAVMQMDLLNKDFLVFVNSSNNLVNVIYKRQDDNYGLIEAKAK